MQQETKKEDDLFVKGDLTHYLYDGMVQCGGMPVFNCNNSFTSKKVSLANADRVVKCWNEYEKLKEENALLLQRNKELLEALCMIIENTDNDVLQSIIDDYNSIDTGNFGLSIINQAKAAIANNKL